MRKASSSAQTSSGSQHPQAAYGSSLAVVREEAMICSKLTNFICLILVIRRHELKELIIFFENMGS